VAWRSHRDVDASVVVVNGVRAALRDGGRSFCLRFDASWAKRTWSAGSPRAASSSRSAA